MRKLEYRWTGIEFIVKPNCKIQVVFSGNWTQFLVPRNQNVLAVS
jgi:hypothetical protein